MKPTNTPHGHPSLSDEDLCSDSIQAMLSGRVRRNTSKVFELLPHPWVTLSNTQPCVARFPLLATMPSDAVKLLSVWRLSLNISQLFDNNRAIFTGYLFYGNNFPMHAMDGCDASHPHPDLFARRIDRHQNTANPRRHRTIRQCILTM